jgi:hypothetical protein
MNPSISQSVRPFPPHRYDSKNSLLQVSKVVRRPRMLVTSLLTSILAAAVLLLGIVRRPVVLQEEIVDVGCNLESRRNHRPQKGSLRYGVPP